MLPVHPLALMIFGIPLGMIIVTYIMWATRKVQDNNWYLKYWEYIHGISFLIGAIGCLFVLPHNGFRVLLVTYAMLGMFIFMARMIRLKKSV